MRLSSFFLSILLLLSIDAYAGNQQLVLKVEGMTCPSCAASVERNLKALPQVKSVDISLSKGSVAILLKDGTSLSQEQASKAIQSAGYKVKSVIEQPGS